jgi:hypothetical protein
MYLQLNSRAWCLRVLGCQLCCFQVYQCGITIWMLDVVCYFKNCLLQWVLAVALIVIGLFSRWLHTAIFQYITPQIRCLGEWVQKLFVAFSLVIGSNTVTSFFSIWSSKRALIISACGFHCPWKKKDPDYDDLTLVILPQVHKTDFSLSPLVWLTTFVVESILELTII